MIKSIMFQCFDLGCIQVVLYLSGVLSSVGDAQIVFRTFVEEKQAVGVNLAYSVLSKHSCPAAVIPSYSCIEVSKRDKLFTLWSFLYDMV